MSAAEPVVAPAGSPEEIEALGAATAAAQRRHDGGLHAALFVGLALLLVFAPFVAYPVFVMRVLCFALFASAFNLLFGFGGLLSFGHAAFFGFASYVSATAAQSWGFTPDLAILAGTATAAVLGLGFGTLAIRSQGIYFAMITLALAQLAYFVALQAPFTGGEDGIQGVPRGRLFGLVPLADDRALYVVVAVIVMAGLLLIYRIVHSPFGQVLRAIRENENRALSLGYRVDHYRLAVFVMSATLAGLAGSTKALVFQLASLSDVHWSMSGEVILMTLIGGVGTIFGPAIGALVFVSLEYYLSSFGSWVTVIEGAVFVVCVLAFREGIVGVLARRIGRAL